MRCKAHTHTFPPADPPANVGKKIAGNAPGTRKRPNCGQAIRVFGRTSSPALDASQYLLDSLRLSGGRAPGGVRTGYRSGKKTSSIFSAGAVRFRPAILFSSKEAATRSLSAGPPQRSKKKALRCVLFFERAWIGRQPSLFGGVPCYLLGGVLSRIGNPRGLCQAALLLFAEASLSCPNLRT